MLPGFDQPEGEIKPPYSPPRDAGDGTYCGRASFGKAERHGFRNSKGDKRHKVVSR